MPGAPRSSRTLRIAAAPGLTAALAALALAVSAAPAYADEAACPNGATQRAVTVGIVKATGCWTQSSDGNVYTAAFADNSKGVDLNGFVVTGDKANGLRINTSNQEVSSVVVTTGKVTPAQLNFHFTGGPLNVLGVPNVIDFKAPASGPLSLEHITLTPFNPAFESFARLGLSLVGSVDVPLTLQPGGTGTMNLTVSLGGFFTVAGKPQSGTIELATEPEEGTKFDGFEIALKAVNLALVKVEDLELHYSSAANLFMGKAVLELPFLGLGVGASATVQGGLLTQLGVHADGLKIPIFAGGFITGLDGGFSVVGVKPADFDGWCRSIGYEGAVIIGADKGPDAYTHWKCHKGSTNDGIDVTRACQWQVGNTSGKPSVGDPNDAHSWICVGFPPSQTRDWGVTANGNVKGQFGPSVPTPFNKEGIALIKLNAGLTVGSTGNQFVATIAGGMKLIGIDVAKASLQIYGKNGVRFTSQVGIGLPHFNNEEAGNDLFVGGGVDGWISGGHFQFEGNLKLNVLGLTLAGADVLINDQGLGGCGTLVGVTVGGFYRWGAGFQGFPFNTCGLGSYREQFPPGAAATAARARTFRLSRQKMLLAVRGAGAAPRFALRSADGRTIRTPATGRSEMGRDYAVAIDSHRNTTYVVLARARGTWTISPYRGSTAITGVRAAGTAPKNRITARVVGSGTTRTLVFHSLRLPNTRLLFEEVLPNGTPFPILNTGAGSGRHRFRVETGSGYGTRRLVVVVTQGVGFSQSAVLARYRVNPPPILRAPRFVDSFRDGFAVGANWTRVAGARGYLVQVYTRRYGRLVASFVRQVPARKTTLWIPNYPATPGRSVATVWALNSDGKLGRGKSTSFFTAPSALTLKAAAKDTVEGAFQSRGAVFVDSSCPARQGHCQVRLALIVNGRTAVRLAYQQAPGTLLRKRLLPANAAARRALARALHDPRGRVRVACRIFRLSMEGQGLAAGTP